MGSNNARKTLEVAIAAYVDKHEDNRRKRQEAWVLNLLQDFN